MTGESDFVEIQVVDTRPAFVKCQRGAYVQVAHIVRASVVVRNSNLHGDRFQVVLSTDAGAHVYDESPSPDAAHAVLDELMARIGQVTQ